jgi:hypothetical protein
VDIVVQLGLTWYLLLTALLICAFTFAGGRAPNARDDSVFEGAVDDAYEHRHCLRVTTKSFDQERQKRTKHSHLPTMKKLADLCGMSGVISDWISGTPSDSGILALPICTAPRTQFRTFTPIYSKSLYPGFAHCRFSHFT